MLTVTLTVMLTVMLTAMLTARIQFTSAIVTTVATRTRTLQASLCSPRIRVYTWQRLTALELQQRQEEQGHEQTIATSHGTDDCQ